MVRFGFLEAAGLPQRPTARTSIQHHPSLPNVDRGIGSLLHLESHPAGHWSPYQTSAGPPELALSMGERPSNSSTEQAKAGESRREQDGVEEHEWNHLEEACSPMASGTRYRLINAAAGAFQTSRAGCRHQTIDISTAVASPGTASSLFRAALTAVERRPLVVRSSHQRKGRRVE